LNEGALLLKDNATYKLWTPKYEEKEFHPIIKEHSKELFGNESLYFDIKHTLKSESRIASIPDAYVITLLKPQWYIVENELATHRVYKHIVSQVSEFITAINNPSSQGEIRDILHKEITQDKVLKTYVEKVIQPEEPHQFLSKLLLKSPKIAIIIDREKDKFKDAKTTLQKLGETEIVEFNTFVREDAENDHAHLFEPLYEEPTHALYVKNENKFLCLVGNPDHNISRLYDPIEIVEHLRDEHRIIPKNQFIHDWFPRFERLWKEHERKKSSQS